MYLNTHLCFFMYALMMFNNSLRMTKTDRNMPDLRQIARKKYNFNITAFVGFIVWIA